MSFVRNSKFRHVFGKENKKEQCYENIAISRSAYEGKFSAANSKFLAVCVSAGGGGAFLVIPLERVGRQDINAFKVAGHQSDVLDLEWNPFNDHVIASCDEDGVICIWEIPENGLSSDLAAPLLSVAHDKKCGQLSWHPSAANILLSVSQELAATVWNLESGSRVVDMEHPDQIYNADWNRNGSKVVTACKDKQFRVFDPRTGNVLMSFSGHKGGKPQRVIFIDDERLFSTGFTKMSTRQFAIWNMKDVSEPLTEEELDSANGTLIPYFDRDINMLYLAAKGDTTIRYYEVTNEDPYVHWINSYVAKQSNRAICMLVKRACHVEHCEVARFYRLVSDKNMVEPVSFTVPRKDTKYDAVIFPDTAGDEPALSCEEWLEGKDADPILVSLQGRFKGTTTATKKSGAGGLSSKLGSKATGAKSSKVESGGGAVDAGTADDLKKEIKNLKAELASAKSEIADLRKLKDEISALKEVVQKNDQRVTVLESLVQEVSDEEGK